jgi:hypothetical protein
LIENSIIFYKDNFEPTRREKLLGQSQLAFVVSVGEEETLSCRGFNLFYYIMTSSMFDDDMDKMIVRYGIRIEKSETSEEQKRKEICEIRDFTTIKEKALGFLKLIAGLKVTPCSLMDIAQDFLCT